MTFILIFFFSLIHSFSLQKTTIIVVQDLPNFPPYETNGEGPSFLDSSSRFLEITNKTDDIEHPDMPDSEPDILIEMQLKVSQFLGLSPNISTNNSNSTFEFPHFLQKPFNTPSETLQNSFEMAHFTEAWASSVYTYKPLSSQHSFSAINAVIGFSYWCSTGLHLKNQIVVWEGVFEYSKRLSHLWIRWAYAPGSFRILSTNDGSNWEELIPWKSGFKGVLWQWLAKVFWWWRWFYKSYSEYVPFPTPIWGKRLRIQMKDPAFNFFGIYRVEAWIKEWTVMLKTAAQSDNEGCLIMADGSGKDHRELQLMDCTEAIAAGDGRELWTLHNNFQITSYVGGKCIEAAEGDVSDGARIQINDCWMSESAGDGREKWLMDHEGLTKLYKEQSKCMTVLTNSDLENLCLNVKAFASNTMNDGQHEAHMAVDGYQDNFWASSPGVEEAIFTMLFQEPKTVKELEIYWKYPAEEFEVLGLITQNLWENIEFVRNSGKTVNVNKVSLLSRNLWGLKIVMLKTRDKFNEQSIYGINDVRCISGTKSVKLKNCHELEDLKTNKFLMEDVGFVDLTAGPRLMMQKVSLNEKTNKLMSLVNVLVGFPKIIYKLLEKGNEIQKIISKLEEKMKGLDIKMSIYRGFLDSEHSNILSSIGSSSLNPIRDCSYVHKAYPHKSNGFYWIKPECSKIALRVFCNFNLNAGKSYAFLGEQAKESTSIPNLKTHIDIQNECAKLGLFPIEIISASELTTIRKYIKALGVNMAENQVIPLGFDWGCLLGACTGRFRSFNSENSLDLSEEFLTNLDSTNVLNMPFNVNGYIKDSVGIGIDNDAGYVLFKLDQFSIKGLLCSSDSNESFEQEFISNLI